MTGKEREIRIQICQIQISEKMIRGHTPAK